MPTVIGIRFKDSGKTYHFDPQNIALVSGDWAIVDTVRGAEMGRVAGERTELAEDQLFSELKPVLRRATEADLEQLMHLQQYEPEALEICKERVAEHALPMQLIKAEYNFDGSRLTFFFTADKRVDFRALVRDLARTFRTRIELRQVGPRDEAKLLGGIGPCGRLLCCSTFLPDFARVSIKMAKDQDLPLNPSKISGVCGRLLCCLSYEHEQYLEIKAVLPQRGDWVQTPEGPGDVIAVNVVKENVTVQLVDGNTIDCTAQQITPVARDRQGPKPIINGEQGLLDDDPDALRALDALEESDRRLSAAQSGAGTNQPPIRPDAALGATVTQNRRAANERARPPAEDRPPSRSDGVTPAKWTPQSNPEPHKVLSGGDQQRPQRPGSDQARLDLAQRQEQAALPQLPDAAPSDQPAQQPGRRRKRNRGRGGKN
jgi:cell fate regulator YaaT (PSP1 superfamily)